MLPRLAPLLLAGMLILSGCTSIIHATTDEPIKPDPSSTSLGTDIDDWQMVIFTTVTESKGRMRIIRLLRHVNVRYDTINGDIVL